MKTSTMPIAVPIQFSGQVTSTKARQGPAPLILAISSRVEVEVDQRQIDRRHHERDEEIDVPDAGGELRVHERPIGRQAELASAMLMSPTGPEQALQRR